LNVFRRIASSERANSMVEYAVILALLCIVVFSVITTLAAGLNRQFQEVASCLNNAPAPCAHKANDPVAAMPTASASEVTR
jgi:Flp pilus assembly pilin Flp